MTTATSSITLAIDALASASEVTRSQSSRPLAGVIDAFTRVTDSLPLASQMTCSQSFAGVSKVIALATRKESINSKSDQGEGGLTSSGRKKAEGLEEKPSAFAGPVPGEGLEKNETAESSPHSNVNAHWPQ
jgi:hypothetical protein